MENKNLADQGRFFGIDLLRVLACFLVIMVHACECYYISNVFEHGYGGETLDAYRAEALWAGIFGTVCRSSVPLFVVVSGYLLLPMKAGTTMAGFLRRRGVRILVPLFVWTALYAIYNAFMADGVDNQLTYILQGIGYFFVNFPQATDHLWYLYMAMGLYLMIPVLSPWVERASRGEMRFVLGIWLVTQCLPFIHLVFPEVWGECFWNPNSTVYYLSGFIGYLLFGAYCRKFLQEGKSCVGLGAGLAVVGFVASFVLFMYKLNGASFATPREFLAWLPDLEFGWNYNCISVAVMTLGLFLLFFRLQAPQSAAVRRVVNHVGVLSFGMYLVHRMLLGNVHVWVDGWTSVTALKIILITLIAFVSSYVAARLLSLLPKSKYIIG